MKFRAVFAQIILKRYVAKIKYAKRNVKIT